MSANPPPDPLQPKVAPEYIQYIRRTNVNQPNSAFNLPVDAVGDPAVYGLDPKGAIHGPVNWDQFENQWNRIGTRYAIQVPPNRPILPDEETFMAAEGLYLDKYIASGGYGCVYSVRTNAFTQDNQGRWQNVILAGKIVSLSRYNRLALPAAVRRFLFESELHSQLDHQNIVKTHKVFRIYDTVSGFSQPIRLCQLMEFCDGDLQNRIKAVNRMDERTAKIWFSQIASAVKYLHDSRIAHMDLKTENIMHQTQANGTELYKLTDFGLSLKFEPNQQMSYNRRRGTPLYMAPEVEAAHTTLAWYSVKPTDIFSLGACLVESLIGSSNIHHLFRCIRDFHQSVIYFSREVSALILMMTNRTPARRSTIDDVLSSPWI